MNTIEQCVIQCPILTGVNDLETRQQLIGQYRKHCFGQRLGQIGLLCGQPTGDDKNAMSRAADAARSQEARLEAARLEAARLEVARQQAAELKV